MSWDNISIERMRALIDNGASASQAARALGRTRNAVIGKCLRLGIRLGPASDSQRAAAYRRRGEVVARRPVQILPDVEPVAVVRVDLAAPNPIGPLDDFPSGYACKWIAGDPLKPDWQCCGHETGGGPWCPYHASKMKTKAGDGVFVIKKQSTRVVSGWAA